MKNEKLRVQFWDCGDGFTAHGSGPMTKDQRPETGDWACLPGRQGLDSWDLFLKTKNESRVPSPKKAAALFTAFVFLWSMCITPVMAETINVQGGSINVSVQENTNTKNFGVTGNPVWNVPEFNVPQGSIYNFTGLSQGASLAMLVNGGNASNIFGTMNISHLDFILQNIAGINIGSSAMINLDHASLIASTLPLNLTATDFLARDYQFGGAAGRQGFLMNEGKIVGSNGDLVALVSNAIENKGTIEVPMGTVALAAGNTVTIGISPDGMVSIGVDEATANTMGLKDQIKNTGTLSAKGGKVVLDAKAIDGLFEKAINIAAESNATAVIVADDGVIEFVAKGNVKVDGSLQAEGGQITTDVAGDLEFTGNIAASNSILTADKVKLTGAADQTLKGDMTFSNFEVTTPGKTIYFEQGKIFTVLGNLKIHGAEGSLIKLLSSQEGSQWYIDPQGQRDIAYVWVKDSYNINPAEIFMTQSTNRGNCYNWDAVRTWSGTVSDLWNLAGNWVEGFVPVANDDLVFPGKLKEYWAKRGSFFWLLRILPSAGK